MSTLRRFVSGDYGRAERRGGWCRGRTNCALHEILAEPAEDGRHRQPGRQGGQTRVPGAPTVFFLTPAGHGDQHHRVSPRVLSQLARDSDVATAMAETDRRRKIEGALLVRRAWQWRTRGRGDAVVV